MNRQIVTSRDIIQAKETEGTTSGPAGSTDQGTKDVYFDRLLKYIPAEVVACYIFVMGLIERLGAPREKSIFHWVVFSVFCFITFFYLRKILHVRKVQQLAISLVAFVVWVFALGGPFTLFSWYNPLYGAILLPVYTLVIAIWEAE